MPQSLLTQPIGPKLRNYWDVYLMRFVVRLGVSAHAVCMWSSEGRPDTFCVREIWHSIRLGDSVQKVCGWIGRKERWSKQRVCGLRLDSG